MSMLTLSLTGILEWANFMRSQGVTRVCCLLDAGQLAGFRSILRPSTRGCSARPAF